MSEITTKQINQLPSASSIGDNDLLVVEQSGVAKKVSGNTLKGAVDGGLSYEAKQALIALLSKAAYIDENGQTYLTALETALFPPSNLVSITATFNQGFAVIHDTDSIDTLKQYLVVTANYSDSTSATVTAYTLTGTMAPGTQTFTVSYGGKTNTFTAVISSLYVTDGLVMWLDGERNGSNGSHNSSITAWVDQSGNGWDWTPHTSATSSDLVQKAKCIEFKGTGYGRYLREKDSLPTNVAMIEVVFKWTSGSNLISGFGRSYPGNVTHWTSGGGVTFQTGTGTSSDKNAGVTYPTGRSGEVNTVNSGGYVNGETATVSTDGNDWQYTYPCIGGYRGSNGTATTYKFAGEIYCIRMYSRILTEAEILANAATDMERFGIEVSE